MICRSHLLILSMEVRSEAERTAAFEADMEPSRQRHEEGHLARDAVEKAVLLEQLEQAVAEITGPLKCQHGRQKSQCKDCGGKGRCLHGRRKDRCKDCGTGYCVHRRRKGRCNDCSAEAIANRQ
jgi:hypothetical protein